MFISRPVMLRSLKLGSPGKRYRLSSQFGSQYEGRGSKSPRSSGNSFGILRLKRYFARFSKVDEVISSTESLSRPESFKLTALLRSQSAGNAFGILRLKRYLARFSKVDEVISST